MKKREAIEKFVERDFNSVPQDWVRTVAEANQEYPNLPMWGTMWIVDNWLGEKLWENSRVMAPNHDEIDLEEIERVEGEEKRKLVEKAIEEEDWSELEMYYDEEMAYERSVLDKDGDPTSMFIYEVGDEFVVGINGAGWDF